MFEKLESRYIFKGDLFLEKELHIGSGKGDARTDALVVKDFSGRPCIPGSSLRGVLRSTIERIASSIGKNPCMLADTGCVTNSTNLQEDFRKILKEKNQDRIEQFLNDDSKICPVCRLFGSTVVASRIRVTDLYLKSDSTLPAVRHGVGINRDTETSQDKAKFDFETVPAQSRFAFELIGENLYDSDLALLAIGIQEMDDGNFWLGGNTARGLGKCKLEGLEIKYFNGPEGLRRYLINREQGLDRMTKEDFFNKMAVIVA